MYVVRNEDNVHANFLVLRYTYIFKLQVLSKAAKAKYLKRICVFLIQPIVAYPHIHKTPLQAQRANNSAQTHLLVQPPRRVPIYTFIQNILSLFGVISMIRLFLHLFSLCMCARLVFAVIYRFSVKVSRVSNTFKSHNKTVFFFKFKVF